MTLWRWVFLSCLTGSSALAGTPAPTGANPPIRVQLVSRQAVVLSSEIAARISAIPVQEGMSFRRGQRLVEFDCGSYRAQMSRAQASLEAASKLVKVNSQLAKFNSVGTLEMAQAEGKAKEAGADVSLAQTLVAKCAIIAPFDGKVAHRMAAVHQYVNTGTPILDIVDAGVPELRLLVPSKWVSRIKPGSNFSVTVDELGKSFPAKIDRLGARIDPVSQSLLAIGSIDGKLDTLLPGMSGWASFK